MTDQQQRQRSESLRSFVAEEEGWNFRVSLNDPLIARPVPPMIDSPLAIRSLEAL